MIGDHLRGTEGASTVPTSHHLTAEVMVAQAAAFAGIFVVTSDVAGVGKSLSTKAAAVATGLEVHVCQFVPDASIATVNATLLDALGVRVGRSDAVPDTTAELQRLLAQRPRLMLVESAHDLSGHALAHLRILHSSAEFTLGFVGHRRFLSRAGGQPELFDSTDRWIRFTPLPPEDMLDCLSQYHPVFATADAGRLAAIEAAHAHGRWKRWAQFLRSALLYAATEGGGELTPRVIDHTLLALDWARPVTHGARGR
jgi:hypothetical protein